MGSNPTLSARVLAWVGTCLLAWVTFAGCGAPSDEDKPQAYSVSQLVAARDSGRLGSTQVPLRGFWSALGLAHSCAPPRSGPPGDLEIYCHENEFGITELNEPIAKHIGDGRVVFADGPHLTPWVENDLWRTLGDSLARPAPIVVVGHFDDPRAAECRPEAVQLCRERFVIDAILEYGG